MEKITFERSRVIGFSDAVFGIAMTLLILENAAPTYQMFSKYGFWPLLKGKIPNFIGFIISFFVTALYWIDYLKLSKFVSVFSIRLLWINIFMLFFVVLLPFSTALYVNGILFLEPFIFYALNLALIALMVFIFSRALYLEEGKKSDYTLIIRNWYSLKTLNTFLIWILAALVALVNIDTARYIWVLIFLIDPIIDRYYKRKIKSNIQNNESDN